MNTKKISFLSTFTIGSLLLSGIHVTATQQSVAISVYYPSMHFVFDSQELTPPEDQRGFIYEGSTYVPLRFISYALNKGVEWDQETYTVSVGAPTKQQQVEIQDYRLNREVRESINNSKADIVQDPNQIEAYFKTINYVFDNQLKQPAKDLPGLIYENTLYVPMRFFSESIGKKIDWDPVTYTVSATTQEVVSKPEPKPNPQPIAKPTSTPTPVIVPGGGGVGGVVVSKPSYDSLKASADAKIAALKTEAESYFLNLLLSSLSATPEQKLALKAQGSAKLEEFNSRFNNIMNDFESVLRNNEYSISIISEYKQEYEAQKAAAKAAAGL
ncbi:stalk domain-containing protein [Paenibacillus sp. HJGM_3]|uniref:stalk domain-containing protein n=1 Tax=Paenibacillus sp. HJGM_3 TaxID=3379816 RepID=UPI00385C6E30